MTQPNDGKLYTAVYYRHHVLHEAQFETLKDAQAFLEDGSQENTLAAEAIIGPSGDKLPIWP